MKTIPDLCLSRAGSRNLNRARPGRRVRWAIVALALGSIAPLACGDRDQPSDLNSILEDGDLAFIGQHALTLGAPPAPAIDAGMSPGTGGTTGGGRGGSPGSIDGSVPSPDAGIATGGSIGSGGRGTAGATRDGGIGGIGGIGGMGGSGGQFPQEAQGLWMFDDCVPDRTDLADSSFNSHTAFRSVSTACVPGLAGQAVGIDDPDDFVYVPDQPNFTFQDGVTVAAWVKPTRLGDIRTIFRKREGGTSTFALISNGKDYQFIVRLSNGRAVAVNARAPLNKWTHVAGTYDGYELRLYINGSLAAQSRAAGGLSSGAGPLLMGNDAFGRRMDGALDGVFFDVHAATPAQILRLNCLPRPSTLIAVPAAGPLVPAGTEVSYDLQITNNACDPELFQFEVFGAPQGIVVNPFFDFREIQPGATDHIALSVSSAPDLSPDDYTIPLSVFGNLQAPPFFEALSTTIRYSVQGGPCDVRNSKELMIRAVSVVEDPVRTAPGGAWTFGRLMEDLAPSAGAAPGMVESVLSTWLSDQTVNGFTIPARPAMQDLVISSFPRRPNGELDLSHAPLRLLAIVNRIDLRDLAHGSAGEGRFVFGVLDPGGNQTQFTMIFEFKVPAVTEQDVLDSANRWHALGALPFPSEEFNAALQAITDRFARRNASPGSTNGSALAQFRTNEIALSFEWQFREFHVSPTTGLLTPATVALTPDLSFRFTPVLTDFINTNEAIILREQHTVPETFAGQPFLTGSVTNDLQGWDAPGVNNVEARHKFSVNTCNGCHSSRETNTGFLQVFPRNPGEESILSGFLTGTQVFDFRDGFIRSFNDLRRRNGDLHLLICPTDPVPAPIPGPVPFPGIGGRGGGRGTGGFQGGTGGSTGDDGGTMGSGGVSGAPGGTGGATVRPTPTPTPIPIPVPRPVPGGASPAAATLPVIDESAVGGLRPDFIAKGISRVH